MLKNLRLNDSLSTYLHSALQKKAKDDSFFTADSSLLLHLAIDYISIISHVPLFKLSFTIRSIPPFFSKRNNVVSLSKKYYNMQNFLYTSPKMGRHLECTPKKAW